VSYDLYANFECEDNRDREAIALNEELDVQTRILLLDLH
jgi:hypothetical protein